MRTVIDHKIQHKLNKLNASFKGVCDQMKGVFKSKDFLALPVEDQALLKRSYGLTTLEEWLPISDNLTVNCKYREVIANDRVNLALNRSVGRHGIDGFLVGDGSAENKSRAIATKKITLKTSVGMLDDRGGKIVQPTPSIDFSALFSALGLRKNSAPTAEAFMDLLHSKKLEDRFHLNTPERRELFLAALQRKKIMDANGQIRLRSNTRNIQLPDTVDPSRLKKDSTSLTVSLWQSNGAKPYLIAHMPSDILCHMAGHLTTKSRENQVKNADGSRNKAAHEGREITLERLAGAKEGNPNLKIRLISLDGKTLLDDSISMDKGTYDFLNGCTMSKTVRQSLQAYWKTVCQLDASKQKNKVARNAGKTTGRNLSKKVATPRKRVATSRKWDA